MVFAGISAISTINVSSTVNSEGTTGDPASQSVTASGGTAPLIVFGCSGSTSQLGTLPTFSPAKDASVGSNAFNDLAYKIYNSSPQDTTIDKGDDGANALQSFYLEAG